MTKNIVRSSFTVLALAGLISLGGCSAGDVQFEGKIFDAVGLSGQQARSADPKVRERAPLVLPPKAELPPPGERVVADKDMNWPEDPEIEQRRKMAALNQERQKYCTEIGRNEKHPFYDPDKAKHCQSLLSKGFNNAFGRAEEPQQ